MRIRTARTSVLIGLLAAVAVAATVVGVLVVRDRDRPPTAFPEATVGSYQSATAMHAAISRAYPTFAAALLPAGTSDWQIPGNDGAWSLDAAGHPAFSTTLTVQDFVETDDQVLISAYDHAHVVDSVLFVLDRRTGAYVKTVILPTTAHVGGLALDPVAGTLYVSDDSATQAQVARLTLAAVEAYDVRRTGAPIAFDAVVPVSDNATTAALAYEDDAIWIAGFDTSGAGTINAYPIDRATGTLASDPDSSAPSTDPFSRLSTSSAEIQGLAFDDDRLLVSFSYGNVPSSIALYRVGRDNDAHPTRFQYRGIFSQVPPYLEGLHLKDGTAHVMFESGSSIHRATAQVSIDRILGIDLDALPFTP